MTERIYQTLLVNPVVHRCAEDAVISERDDDREASSPIFIRLAIARQSCPVVEAQSYFERPRPLPYAVGHTDMQEEG